MSHEEQEHLNPPEHMTVPSVFSGVRVDSCVVFSVMFCRLSFVFFSFCHFISSPSTIDGFLIPFWYIHTFLTLNILILS